MYKRDGFCREQNGRFAQQIGEASAVELSPEDIAENLRDDEERKEFVSIEGEIQDYLGDHYPELLGVLWEEAGSGNSGFIGVRYCDEDFLGNRAGTVKLFDDTYEDLRVHLEDRHSDAMTRLQEHDILNECGEMVTTENEMAVLGTGDNYVYHVGWPA